MCIAAKVFLASEVAVSLKKIPIRPEPKKVLLCTPDFFDIVDVKNVHMQDQQGKINKQKAQQQWKSIFDTYAMLKEKGQLDAVYRISGVAGCEDMVFAANQSFPWVTESGEKIVIMSQMRHESRKREVPFFASFYDRQGYRKIQLQQTALFEGMGDAIPQPGKRLIFGGYGHRTTVKAYDEIAQVLDTPIVALKLINEKFYHLDTCFIPVDDETVLLCPNAFQEEDLQGLKILFKEVIEIPLEEAEKNFALNAHLISTDRGKVAILQKGSPLMVEILKANGFEVCEVDTSEYIKSGGSVFCMKMLFY